MKILAVLGTMYPQFGSNVNLMRKALVKLSEKHEIRIAGNTPSYVFKDELPEKLFGYQAYWLTDSDITRYKRKSDVIISKIIDRNGYSDYIFYKLWEKKLKDIRKEYDFEVIISVFEPFPHALAASKIRNVQRIVYVMDPPEITYTSKGATKYRNSNYRRLIGSNDIVITTPFIREALEKLKITGNFVESGFPMIDDYNCDTYVNRQKDNKINLLFCGWMCTELRSPEYFLNIVSRLDEKYRITFMGRECDKLSERFEIKTKAEIITLPQQPYEKALEAMEKADILVNIGNSVPVHMPSKTLEYINTGKPFVNFYKMEDCPTLYYSERYPLCLNLYEGDGDIENAVKKFTSFCESKKGERVGRDYIVNEFADCTPEYAAKIILDGLVN